MLRILPECKGQSGNTYDGVYVHGAPELLAEIAYSSRALDLHKKKELYEKTGVVEYAVVCLKPQRLYWIDLRAKQTMTADEDGVLRSRAFPGLWIHVEALLQRDYKLSMEVLQQGLASPDHQLFVERLSAARQ